MEIKKIKIENFKSIEKMEFEINKIGESYTSILVGINESGKSNILQAFSFLNTPKTKYNFSDLCNQKNEAANYIDLFFYLEFEHQNTYVSEINEEIEYAKPFKFFISDIIKNVYLSKDTSLFKEDYNYTITLPKEKLFYHEITTTITVNGANKQKNLVKLYDKNDELNTFNELTSDNFIELFNSKILEIIKKYEPAVSFWTPSEEFLISEVDLNKFKENINSNKPLKNIFHLAGINTSEKIIQRIDKLKNGQQRSRLISQLEDSLNTYLDEKWKHSIDTVIDITESGMFTLSLKDKGDENKHDRFSINERSEGAKHFLSLILSLSLESNNRTRTNQLILIDEPEQHLHPSGIRDLSRELLNIGKRNYVFVATHSPFLIDKSNKNRHYIIKKNKKAITEKKDIQEHQSIIDDEVLREAFGVEVYRDLLNPHSLIVEGASDKIIIQKIFQILGKTNIGITNGHGSNIDTLAAKLNYDNISVLVVVDDDREGKKYKKNILSLGGIYTINNVFTIRDLVGDVIEGATIEDLLDINYIKQEFKTFYNKLFEEEIAEFEVEQNRPIIDQLIIVLKQNQKFSNWDLDLFKKELSDNFKPNKTSLNNKNPLLKAFAERLLQKMKN